MKKILFSLVVCGFASTLFAAAPASYVKCVACHGANGEKVALGKSKIMNQLSKQEIKDALMGYQKGTYGGAMKGVMIPQVKNLSAENIDEIANFIGK